MCGVHYRFDSQEGLLLGETVAVRLLQQASTRTRDIDEVSPLHRDVQSDHKFEPHTLAPSRFTNDNDTHCRALLFGDDAYASLRQREWRQHTVCT